MTNLSLNPALNAPRIEDGTFTFKRQPKPVGSLPTGGTDIPTAVSELPSEQNPRHKAILALEDPEAVEYLARSESSEDRYAALINGRLTAQTFVELSYDEDEFVRGMASSGPSLSAEDIARLAADDSENVRRLVAAHCADVELLVALSQDSSSARPGLGLHEQVSVINDHRPTRVRPERVHLRHGTAPPEPHR